MTKVYNFDALVVYSEKAAMSAYDDTEEGSTPFRKGAKNEAYNSVYGYFLEACERCGLRVAFTTSADIIGPGYCRSFWKCVEKEWIKVKSPCFSSLIFDKFSPVNEDIKRRRRLLFSLPEIKPFNSPNLFDLFFDKHKTSEELARFSIPTILLKSGTLAGISGLCLELVRVINDHPNTDDFSSDLIMKDRYGAGGRRIYRIKTGQYNYIETIMRHNPKRSFIIQPFVKFDRGYSYGEYPARTEIRLVYLGGEIVQTYIRVAISGEFRCNEHRGGLLTYIDIQDVPDTVINMSRKISSLLGNNSSLYALDFIVSNNNNVYLLEGNTGPGLDWNSDVKQNEMEAKKLIHMIVKQMLIMVKTPEISNTPQYVADSAY